MIRFFPTGYNRPPIDNLSGSDRLKDAGMLFHLGSLKVFICSLSCLTISTDSHGTFGSGFLLIGAQVKIFSGHPCISENGQGWPGLSILAFSTSMNSLDF